jgi:hypothetical protein
MKFSDKALRLIGRQLIENRTTKNTDNEPPGLRLQNLRCASKAAVLPFKKRLR